jgi:anaerobic ribonucleoside-triphosphate reductase activating protein
MDEIIDNIEKNPLLRGITFSGGEPWDQAEKFAYIAERVKSFGLNIWCYTGYTLEYILEHKQERRGWVELLHYIDVLVDGKFEEDKKIEGLKFRGSSNQRIIDVKGSLEAMQAVAVDMYK